MIKATVPDKAAGDTFTEAMWDTYIKDNLNGLADGGTSLPANPIDGQVYHYLVGSGVVWQFRYNDNGGAPGTYPWEFIGGGQVLTATTTTVASASGTYVGDTNGRYTIPLAGDWEVTFGGSGSSSVGNGYINLGIMINGAQPVGGDRQIGGAAPTAGFGVAIPSQDCVLTGLAVNDLIGMGVSAPVGGTATGTRRWTSLHPRRVA